MAAQFHLEIITPTKVIDEGLVDYVRAPGVDGSFGVLARHTNAIMAIAIGEIKVVKGSVENSYACTQGFAEITKEGVQLLVETAEQKDDIDLQRAQEAFDRAKAELQKKHDELADEEEALKALERSMNRMRIAKK
ncbi:MAG: ATP synthase F1 subunit epsilon [Candidatus Marinimicrobia bacterium]|nr:ATP synthase F1 subunit epsilon [Candidatus Neomarinimicrobiota bacterium]MCF7850749.1 ATP synthase F1 subunit epsilon [Candidatus Neomarinimicrobiota bacterium]MCF7905247.1 ATP synthase F1 subunit epsilon [Candidatus Neomarinimicrobiota bacterium]